MRNIDSAEIIAEILIQSSRIKFLLLDRYNISPEEITKVIIDGENRKVDFRTETTNLRFKMKEEQHVLLPAAHNVRILEIALDPWRWHNIAEIIHDWDT
jgi:hypothetical protein